MISLLFLGLLACFSRPITQGGHTLEITETKTRKMGYGAQYGVELSLDGAPLDLAHWYAPVSPPMDLNPRIFYWGGGTSPETWEWGIWEIFQIRPSDPKQHQAAKEFLDAGTKSLFSKLKNTDAYEWSYARQVFVLWQQAPKDIEFTASTGERFTVTDSGAIFMEGARIGQLEATQGQVDGVEVRLEPHTFGAGPAEIEINPLEQDLRAYLHPSGQNIFAIYGIPQATP
ncbi:MAG: hypothetical protein ACI9VR_005281 [Cognaticolwellia sp.]|jgi:hypothetical protein